MPYYIAKKWQAAIDEGKNLPDLYIVQISIGSQGIINGMWNRDKEPVIKPGVLGKVDISLLPLALHINRLVMKNLTDAGKNPEVIGWRWIGCEQDVLYEAYLRDDLSERYDYHFDVMRESMGGDVPTYLYKIFMREGIENNNLPLESEDIINSELVRQAGRFGAKLVDVKESPCYDENDKLYYGILASNNAHYTPELQEWFADKFMSEILK